MRCFGIIVGCDLKQEWLLSWWWRHYQQWNDYPVYFVDFGMTQKGRKWCQEKGTVIELPSHQGSSKLDLPKEVASSWEERYGAAIWSVRSAWLKKPLALLQYPLEYGLWLDLDCQVKKNLEPLFHSLNLGFEIGAVRDLEQNSDFMLPNEISYNSGVIAFRKGPFLENWAKVMIQWERQLPGDLEMLSRAIFLYDPKVIELSSNFNWYFPLGANENASICHFCGGMGKIAILKDLLPEDCDPFLIPKMNDDGKFVIN